MERSGYLIRNRLGRVCVVPDGVGRDGRSSGAQSTASDSRRDRRGKRIMLCPSLFYIQRGGRRMTHRCTAMSRVPGVVTQGPGDRSSPLLDAFFFRLCVFVGAVAFSSLRSDLVFCSRVCCRSVVFSFPSVRSNFFFRAKACLISSVANRGKNSANGPERLGRFEATAS